MDYMELLVQKRLVAEKKREVFSFNKIKLQMDDLELLVLKS